MKKTAILSVSILLFVSLLTQTARVANAESQPKAWPKYMSFGGSFAGGIGQSISIAMSALITKYVPGVHVTAEPTSGATEATRLLSVKKVDLAFVGTDPNMYWAVRGLEQFPQKVPARIMISGKFVPYHIFTLPGTGIKSIRDFKGKRVVGKLVGSRTAEVMRKSLFRAYGMTDADVKLLSASSIKDACDQLKEGLAVAVMLWSGAPSPAVKELAVTKGVRMIPVGEQESKAVLGEGVFIPGTLTAGTYKGQKDDVRTMGAPMNIAVRPELDTDLVYAMIKAILEHEKEFVAYHPACRAYTKKYSLLSWSAPYHPGAIKYFREKGLWTREMDDKQAKLLEEVGQ